jgi:hypothetical protein
LAPATLAPVTKVGTPRAQRLDPEYGSIMEVKCRIHQQLASQLLRLSMRLLSALRFDLESHLDAHALAVVGLSAASPWSRLGPAPRHSLMTSPAYLLTED